MNFKNLSLNTYFHIILITSAISDAMNKYNVSRAAFDQTFNININGKMGMIIFIALFLFFDNLESFNAYLILKNAYMPIITPNIIP